MNPVTALIRLIGYTEGALTDARAHERNDEAAYLTHELEQARVARRQIEILVTTSNAFLNAPHHGRATNSQIAVNKARLDLHNALQPFRMPLE